MPGKRQSPDFRVLGCRGGLVARAFELKQAACGMIFHAETACRDFFFFAIFRPKPKTG
jgi:hypothetical protein